MGKFIEFVYADYPMCTGHRPSYQYCT